MSRRQFVMREAVLAVAVVATFLLFAFTVSGFASWQNFAWQALYWVAPGLIAIPMTYIIATAGIDLSVGSMVALCGVTLGILYNDAGWPIWLAAAAAVAAGLAMGAVNGAFSSYAGVPPLVVTLATMALYRGLAMGFSKARSLGGFPDSYLWLGTGDLLPGFATGSGMLVLPFGIVVLLAATALGAFILRRTWIGRFTEHIGENETAARFAAIRVDRMKFALYTACGFVCGVAALFYTAIFGTAKADMAAGLELEVITCVVIGGTRISGGQASVIGSLLGLVLIGILRFGLEMAGLRSQHIVILIGLLLIVTAVLNERMGRTSG
jgi:rhamnose transport system permease protein